MKKRLQTKLINDPSITVAAFDTLSQWSRQVVQVCSISSKYIINFNYNIIR